MTGDSLLRSVLQVIKTINRASRPRGISRQTWRRLLVLSGMLVLYYTEKVHWLNSKLIHLSHSVAIIMHKNVSLHPKTT